MYWLQLLEALSEIAFGPEMLNHRIEKERKARNAEGSFSCISPPDPSG